MNVDRMYNSGCYTHIDYVYFLSSSYNSYNVTNPPGSPTTIFTPGPVTTPVGTNATVSSTCSITGRNITTTGNSTCTSIANQYSVTWYDVSGSTTVFESTAWADVRFPRWSPVTQASTLRTVAYPLGRGSASLRSARLNHSVILFDLIHLPGMYDLRADAKADLSRRSYRGKQWTTCQPKSKYFGNTTSQVCDRQYLLVLIRSHDR